MKLADFISDMGRGWTHAHIYINPAHVASVVPITDEHDRTNNRTIITMLDGSTKYVTDSPSVVAAELENASLS